MLRGCSAVTLQKCFYGQEASLNSSSSRGSHLWANCSFKHVYSSSVFTFISWRGEVSRCSPLIWVSDAVVRASYCDVTTRVTVSYWSNIWVLGAMLTMKLKIPSSCKRENNKEKKVMKCPKRNIYFWPLISLNIVLSRGDVFYLCRYLKCKWIW